MLLLAVPRGSLRIHEHLPDVRGLQTIQEGIMASSDFGNRKEENGIKPQIDALAGRTPRISSNT